MCGFPALFSTGGVVFPPDQVLLRRSKRKRLWTKVSGLQVMGGFAGCHFPTKSATCLRNSYNSRNGANHDLLNDHYDAITDFFKDYPPVDGGDQNETSSAAPMSAFIMSDGSVPAEDMEPNASVIAGDEPLMMSEPSPVANGSGAHILYGTEGGNDADSYDDGSDEDEKVEECPAVSKWRADFAKRLEETLIRERKVKKERSEQAVNTLQNLHKRWDSKRRSAAEANKGMEGDMIQKRDSTLAKISKPGGEPNWNVVPELVDMSGIFKEGARDTSRMRQVLLRMKTH